MNMKIACFIILSLIPVALMESAESSAESSSAEAERTKRSGLPIGGVLQSLQKSAFGASASLSQGSASAVAGLSGASSGGSGSSGHDVHTHTYGHDYDEHHQDTKAFDGWSLKKSILNTLLQAVKAIAGGVTTLQGQLIKGSGYLVQQKGKLIQSGGDAVTNAGKNIVSSAHLIKPDHDSGHGYSAGGSFGGSIGGGFGQAIGNSLGGLTKTLTSLSAGSSSGITSASGASSAGSSSHGSSGHATSGHSDGGYTSQGDYAAIDHGHGVTYTNSFDNYDTKPVTYESYGPPKSTVSHIEQPHAIYGTPEHNDHYSNRIVIA